MSKSDADKQTDSHHAETQSESTCHSKCKHVPTKKNVSLSARRVTKEEEEDCVFI